MSTVLDNFNSELAKRLKELEPMVEEHRQLSAIAEKLGAPAASNGRTAPKRERAARKPAGATSGKRGRPAGSGKRALEVHEIIRSFPGITVSEIAEKMQIKPNYLYRLLPGLEKDGRIVKVGKGYTTEPPA
jgi:DNA-binding IclR family transcriptional regulator